MYYRETIETIESFKYLGLKVPSNHGSNEYDQMDMLLPLKSQKESLLWIYKMLKKLNIESQEIPYILITPMFLYWVVSIGQIPKSKRVIKCPKALSYEVY